MHAGRARKALSLLTARALPLDGAPGGKPGLTGMDVASATAGAYPVGRMVALQKWAHERANTEELVELLRKDLWQRNRKKLSADLFDRLLRLAVVELVVEPKCQRCRGAGIHLNQRVCAGCGGHGLLIATDEARQELVGVTESVWRRKCARPYRAIVNRLTAEEGAFLVHVAERLG